MKTCAAVFLDKDGTLIEDVPYNVDLERIRPAAGAIEALRLLSEAGYELVVVSNQAGVAFGYFDESSIGYVEQWLADFFRKAGVPFGGLYYCPHHPEGTVREFAIDCGCRKPNPGMLERAAAEKQIRLSDSWMVGDILDDVEAGNRAGSRTVLIDNGGETEWRLGENRRPAHYASNLLEAAKLIVHQRSHRATGSNEFNDPRCARQAVGADT